jgi:uncharacterized delta-60 repeat protein
VRLRIAVVGLVVGLVALPGAAYAGTDGRGHGGVLDRSFGTNGKVITGFGGYSASADALVVQSDGKVVVTGQASAPNDPTAVGLGLARYNRDGSLDASFGSGGKTATGVLDRGHALVVQPDGKLVVAGPASTGGLSGSDFGLARFNRDGSLDASFGAGGVVTTDLGASDVARALVIQADGKLVAAGFTGDPTSGPPFLTRFALVRYHHDGTLDATFGSGGSVTTTFGGVDLIRALVLQADGRLVAAGVSETATGFEFALARYNRNGSLDTRFGVGGKVTTRVGGGGAISAVVVQPDGRLVAAGGAYTDSPDFALARYNRNGTLDTSFGTGGTLTTDFGGNLDEAYALAAQADGRLVAAGTRYVEGYDVALARYNRDGTLDTRFGTGGKVTTDFGTDFDQANALAVQADGKLVAAGSSASATSPASSNWILARYKTKTACT